MTPTPKSILIKGDGIRIERLANEAITPGELLDVDADGEWIPHGGAGGNATPIFAMENEQIGGGVDDDIAANDQCQALVAWRGSVIYAWLKDGENVADGDELESDGAGALRAHTAPSEAADGPVALSIGVEDLAANADIAERAEFVVPAALNGATIVDVDLLSKGTAAGIDASNTCLVKLTKVGTGDIVSETFDDGTAFPAANTAHDMGAITNATLATGDVLGIVVTNGTNADPPAFVLVVSITFAASTYKVGAIVGRAKEDKNNSAGTVRVRIKVEVN